MATIIPTTENPMKGEYIFTWANMLVGDVGAPVTCGYLSAQRSMSVQGNFGVSGLQVFELANTTNTPATADWRVGSMQDGMPLSFTTPTIREIVEGARWHRPSVTAGDGTTNLTVRLRAYARPR